jgi:ATP-dependent protease Clp ATPase subunit
MSLFSVEEQAEVVKQLSTVFETFKKSRGKIRPHFMLTGSSGSGKSANIEALAKHHKFDFIEINAAQLTVEGVSGNSLSKALSPLREAQNSLVVCFVDEFDKLFIRGSSNSELGHDSTTQVQNEFLKILEAQSVAVFGDYGKYTPVNTDNVLYVFAGAFNGAKDLDVPKLKAFGIRPEFLGRVSLVFNMPAISLNSYFKVLQDHSLLAEYLKVFPNFDKNKVLKSIKTSIEEMYDNNVIGLRLISSLIHTYFIRNITKETK